MKYIRAKDGIYEILKEHKLPVGNDIYYITNHKNFYSYEVIDKADTIEELCDEFIGVVGNMHRQLTGTNIRSWNDCTIYGAIWTDKGLIYVAKMNDKGELELL